MKQKLFLYLSYQQWYKTTPAATSQEKDNNLLIEKVAKFDNSYCICCSSY